jgi:hypothetical protein
MADEVSLPLWTAAATTPVLAAAQSLGYGDQELGAVGRALREMSTGGNHVIPPSTS